MRENHIWYFVVVVIAGKTELASPFPRYHLKNALILLFQEQQLNLWVPVIKLKRK